MTSGDKIATIGILVALVGAVAAVAVVPEVRIWLELEKPSNQWPTKLAAVRTAEIQISEIDDLMTVKGFNGLTDNEHTWTWKKPDNQLPNVVCFAEVKHSIYRFADS